MSTGIGHCVAALGIAEAARPGKEGLRPGLLVVLCSAALLPDADYLLGVVGVTSDVRVTHSIVVAIAFPVAVIGLARLWRADVMPTRAAVALLAAGVSHVVLDLLVGVTPAPLLWPFTRAEFSLPFGILPSAGALRMDNLYLYRNLVIELGVLVPLVTAVFLFRRAEVKKAIVCACVSAPFMLWAACLMR